MTEFKLWKTGFLVLGFWGLAFALINQPTLSPALSNNTTTVFPLYERVMEGLDGKNKSLASWRGKVIVANFWASWCGPCQYEIPRLKKWQQQFASRGLQVVGIGLDVPDKLRNVARSLGIDYPLLVMSLKTGRPVLAGLGNQEMIIPFTLIINRDGSIAYKHKGLIGQDEFDIMIAPLL
jgi:thiol-disulfide isomerase/thioredoxin